MTVDYMRNMMNSVILSVCSVVVSLILGVPAAYAFARFKFRGGEDMAFTLLTFRFAPPLLVLLPLLLYFQLIGLNDTYFGLVWVYQLITLPLVLWIVRGYFEDVSEDIELAYRLAAITGRDFLQDRDSRWPAPASPPPPARLHLCWNNFIFALILASSSVSSQ